MNRWIAAFAALLSFLPVAASVAADLEIAHAYARPSAARNGAAYLTIENKGAAADRLVGVASPRAAKVELHTHIMDGDIMRMRPVQGVDVPAGGKAELKPGGFHVMLLGLTAPLKAGDAFPLTLQFEKAGKVEVSVRVEKP